MTPDGAAITTDETRAHLAYVAYAASAGWRNYAGLPMPQWADLPDAIRAHWQAAVVAIQEAS